LYGPTYLPRKFKIAFALPPINDVDVLANDLGFIGVLDNDELIGFNVTVGGGMGASHGDPETYPRLADVIGFITPGQLFATAEAVLTTQRDFGNRVVRKRARLKYTIDDRGLDWFIAEVQRRAGFAFAPAHPFHFDHNGDRFGWTEGEDGRWHLTLQIEAGRVVDRQQARQLTGLREIARIHHGEFRLTPNQNLIVAGIPPEQRPRIEALVRAHGLDGYARGSAVRRQALACVALPTCSLAMAEAERYLPDFLDQLEPLLAKFQLQDAPISLRISGCPNGCSRPYLGEIALIGKAPGRYNMHLGADFRGQRLNQLVRENITEPEILSTLEPLLARYADERREQERFGDFLLRVGVLHPQEPKRIALELQS